MRLIDADALWDELTEDLEDGDVLYRIPPDAIDNAPTVDAVPVVRCRECTKRGTNNCPMEQDYPWISSDSNGFCSYGERREAGHDEKEN